MHMLTLAGYSEISSLLARCRSGWRDAPSSVMKSIASKHETGEPAVLKSLVGLTRAAGPYLAIELLLPGGSLIALAVWLYRRWV